MKSNFFLNLIFFGLLPFIIKCQIIDSPPNENQIIITLEEIYNNESFIIGQKGTLVFTINNINTSDIFNIPDIENKTSFSTLIIDTEKKSYNIICRFWNPTNNETNSYLKLFCDLEKILEKNDNNYTFIPAKFNYENYIINVVSEINRINIKQYSKEIPFLYSGEQIINVDKNDSYEIKFNIGKYNNEILILSGGDINMIIINNNCTIKEKELICKISKEKLEERYQKENQSFSLMTHLESIGFIHFKEIGKITVSIKIKEKETLYVEIDTLLDNAASIGEYIPCGTNVKSVPYILTKEYEININGSNYIIFLRKSEGTSSLLLLIKADKKGNFSLFEIERSLKVLDMHPKFNFLIGRIYFHLNEVYEVEGEGTQMIINYPEILDFSDKDILEITYYIENPEVYKSIKINPDSDKDLECINDINMKKCKVPKSHFSGKPYGYYYTYHLNHLNKYSAFYSLAPIKVIFPIEHEIILRINKELNLNDKVVEKDGIISFKTDLKDEENLFNISEIEEKSVFETKLKDNINNAYNATCRLWKPINDYIRVICNFSGSIHKKASYIYLNNITFEYDNKYNIILIQITERTGVISLDKHFPFLYSNAQTINIDDNVPTYELRFNIVKYYNEFIAIQNYNYDIKYEYEYVPLIIENCSQKGNELVCILKKEDILEILRSNNDNFSVTFLSNDFGYYYLNDAGNITINYNTTIKEDIYVELTELKEKYIHFDRYITFETNVSSLDNIVSKYINFTFNGNLFGDVIGFCFFKKSKSKNLLLLCLIRYSGYFHLKANSLKFEFNNIHYKYNFKIQPIKYDFTFEIITPFEGFLFASYPKILNFSQNNSIEILLIAYFYHNYRNNFKLNSASKFLDCKDLWNVTKCKVPRNHFNESGYYNLLYNTKYNDTLPFNEISPFEVVYTNKDKFEIFINKEDNNDIIKLGEKGIIYLITDYNETNDELNKAGFEKLNFSINFSVIGNENEIYESSCHFWKPKNEKLRIICELKNGFESEENIITLKEINIDYNDNIALNIKSNLEYIRVKQLDTPISFIYSDKQEINIEQTQENLTLIFKQLAYDQKPLYLYQNDMRYIKLNDCKTINVELICELNITNLKEILANSEEKYYIGEKFDTGLYIFKSVLDITFNYQIDKKEDININTIKLLTQVVSKNEFIAYETNIDNINELITTNYFDINSNENGIMKCLFKKNNNYNKLLLLCNATTDGQKSLGKINSNKSNKLNDIHILYNINFGEIINNEIYNISGIGTKITSVSPLEIEFNEEKKETFKIIYETENPERLNNIKLNNELLHCENKIWYKECSVNITLFIQQGIYNTTHLNHQKGQTTNYEASGINITFTNDYYGVIVGLSILAGMVVIIVVGFLVWRYLKKQDDNEMDMDVEKEDIELDSPINNDEKDN